MKKQIPGKTDDMPEKDLNIWQKKLVEIILVAWVLIFMFFWWILSGSPGLKYKLVKKMPYRSEIIFVFKKTKIKVWPYIYRPYIWDENSKKDEN